LAVSEEGREPPFESEPEASARLVSRISSGDHAAEHEMYERYARAIILILKRRGATQQEAEDVCHDTFVTACIKLRSAGNDGQPSAIRKSQSLASYLQGIAINKLIGERRKTFRRDTWADSDLIERAISKSDGPFEGAAAEQIRHILQVALDGLSVVRDRDVLVSLYLQDEDRVSIQRRLDIEPEHFHRVVYRAKQRLATRVAELLAEGGPVVTKLRDYVAERH
jgi:RNA polymerase sigma-70 factor, ECF subfamily